MSRAFQAVRAARLSRGPIVLATSNPGKLREIRQALGELPVEVMGLDQAGATTEVAEDGATFADNARQKALQYARALGRWCLADDSGLEVDALGGRPGVRSARYAAADLPPGASRRQADRANNRKLLAELAGVPERRRTARFVCHLALADPRGVLVEAADTFEGRIARQPRGDNGFGYDPVFFIPELGCTAAELTAEQKNRISHRGKAVGRFAEVMRRMLERARAT